MPYQNGSAVRTGPVLEAPRGSMINPLFYFVAQGLVAGVTILSTKNRSLSRLPALATVLWLAYLEFTSAVAYGSIGFVNSTVTSFAFLYTAQLVNILWINSISSRDFNVAEGPTKENVPRNPVLLVFRLVAFNFRGVRTPWKAKNVPAFPSYYPRRMPQSRTQFLTRQTAILAFQCLIIDFVAAQASKSPPENKDRLMGKGLEFAYFSSTREQWIFRICSTIGLRWFGNRCFLSALYNLVSVVGVASGFFSPEDFPPYMGSMWSSYTIRGYWGKFWHQTLRWPHTALSGFITRDLLHLPKPSLLERYSNVFLAFTLSGIFHVFMDIGNGKSELALTMLFFQSFTFGIMLEDGVQALWRRYSGEKFASENGNEAVWKKIVGFVWVFSFFTLVAPWYIYPAARAPPESAFKLPLEVTKTIGEKAAGTTLVVLGSVLLLVFKAEI